MSALGVEMDPSAAEVVRAWERPPDVSVVIVTHDSAAFIGTCLRAVEASEFSGRIDVVVVDNASTDGTAEAVRAGFPQVRLVRPRVRGGFARNTNLGIGASRGRFVVLLNPDTALEPQALSVLWQTLEARPEVGAIGPLLVGEDGHREASARRFPSFQRMLAQSLMLDRLLAALPGINADMGRDENHDREVDWLTGACLMVRREAIDGNESHARVGLLDERIFLFVEDTEWCWRLHTAGWRVLYTPRARVLHHKGSGEGFREWRYTLNCRGHAYFFRKHRGVAGAWGYQAILVPGLLLRAAIAAIALPFMRADREELVRRMRGYLRLAARILAGRLEREEWTE